MRIVHVPRREASFNMTPLIDIVFMLILFFMLTLQLEKEQSGQVDLPKADRAEAVEKLPPESMVVIVLPNGNLIVNGRNQTLGDFEAEIYATPPASVPKALVVRGDGDVSFEIVQGVMRAAATIGVTKVNLLASRETEEIFE